MRRQSGQTENMGASGCLYIFGAVCFSIGMTAFAIYLNFRADYKSYEKTTCHIEKYVASRCFCTVCTTIDSSRDCYERCCGNSDITILYTIRNGTNVTITGKIDDATLSACARQVYILCYD